MAATETSMTASETTMAGEATAMSAAETARVTSAVLRPDGYSQEKRERRDGRQTAHTRGL